MHLQRELLAVWRPRKYASLDERRLWFFIFSRFLPLLPYGEMRVNILRTPALYSRLALVVASVSHFAYGPRTRRVATPTFAVKTVSHRKTLP